MKGLTFKTLIRFLDVHPGRFTYGEIAIRIGTCARAVGQMVKALANRGLHRYCVRVVSKATGKPLADC